MAARGNVSSEAASRLDSPAPSPIRSEEDEDDKSTSTSFAELAPKMRAQFSSLSSTLMETHDNLHTFEFMLGQYRQLAKITPMSGGGQDAGQLQQEQQPQLNDTQTEKIESLLRDLNSAVGKLAGFKDQMARLSDQPSFRSLPPSSSAVKPQSSRGPTSAEAILEADNERLRARVASLERDLEREKADNALLRTKLTAEATRGEQLVESVHRARKSLDEERERNGSLDRKLDCERKAARKVGQDITRYVEQMKSMEEEVKSLRRELKVNKRPSSQAPEQLVEMVGDTLSVVTSESARPSPVTGISHRQWEETKAELARERARSDELDAKTRVQESQIRDYEAQLFELKRGLETLQVELEKYQANGALSSSPAVPLKEPPTVPTSHAAATVPLPPDSRTVTLHRDGGPEAAALLGQKLEALRSRCKRNEADLRSVRASSRTLLVKYEEKKAKIADLVEKMRRARAAVADIQRVCSREERNFRAIVAHLGGEIEISARLMGAYLNLEINHPPNNLRSRRNLAAWFRNVQNLSAWLRQQIAAFGKRYWTRREMLPSEAVLTPFPVLESCGGGDSRGEATVEERPAWTDRSGPIVGTVSEISESLCGEEDDPANSIFDLIDEQDRINAEKMTLFSSLARAGS